jgi:hypothetical protein
MSSWVAGPPDPASTALALTVTWGPHVSAAATHAARTLLLYSWRGGRWAAEPAEE